jgi:ATP phosphoribosyltransferase
LARLTEEGDNGPLALLLDAIDGVRDAESWLHLEVVGGAAPGQTDTAELVANHVRDRGGLHVARGEVRDEHGRPGWRVTALFPAQELTANRRTLFRLGANRVVGLPPRFVYDRGMPSTYDDLLFKLTIAVEGEALRGSATSADR